MSNTPTQEHATTSIILLPEEVATITGYVSSKHQLVELLRQGFNRARMSPTSRRIILERSHFEKVCAGDTTEKRRPQVLVPQPTRKKSP